jgi:hypothetical protein
VSVSLPAGAGFSIVGDHVDWSAEIANNFVLVHNGPTRVHFGAFQLTNVSRSVAADFQFGASIFTINDSRGKSF